MTLAKYIDMYIEQVKSGARQTEQGRNYAPSTIKSIVTALNQWKAFQQSVHKVYDYDIMKITGNATPAMLRKYIKAENLTVVEKITDKYNYFD